jgi:hypothetical protein
MKGIRKQKKKRRREKKNMKLDLREPFQPSLESSPRPTRPTPEPLQPSLSHSLTSGPQLPVFFHLRPVTTLVTVSLREQ